MKILLILLLAMPVAAQNWRVVAQSDKTVIMGYKEYDTDAKRQWVRVWLKAYSDDGVIKYRSVIDCTDFSNILSVNTTSSNHWIANKRGTLGWSVAQFYCDAAGFLDDEW